MTDPDGSGAAADRTAPDSTAPGGWDYEYRPRRTPRLAVLAAIVVLAIHITVGALLRISDTGVRVFSSDQVAVGLIGVVFAAAILLLTRSRLRIGPAGVAVRNLVGERVFGWDVAGGLSYPDKGWCARLLLPGDEYVLVFAIQAGDGERAVEAMNRARDIEARYRATVPPQADG